jgi:hypothetical protein
VPAEAALILRHLESANASAAVVGRTRCGSAHTQHRGPAAKIPANHKNSR